MLRSDKARNDCQLLGNALNGTAFEIDLADNSFGRFTLAAGQVDCSSGDRIVRRFVSFAASDDIALSGVSTNAARAEAMSIVNRTETN